MLVLLLALGHPLAYINTLLVDLVMLKVKYPIFIIDQLAYLMKCYLQYMMMLHLMEDYNNHQMSINLNYFHIPSYDDDHLIFILSILNNQLLL
jgi:hypothetical protein